MKKINKNYYKLFVLFLLFTFFINLKISAQEVKAEEDIFSLSIESLMDIEITSTSKKAEKLFNASSSIYVITSDEIKRSGHLSIPEILRLVPGLQVGQINTANWAITSRGFNYVFANKLLVLIDGRSVYTPLYGGVYWDIQDLILDDIERIEVIKGPGATLWGTNAVNGVINIITKSSTQTKGTLINLASGTKIKSDASLRYGSSINNYCTFKLYYKYKELENTIDKDENSNEDEASYNRGGFRIDYKLNGNNNLTFSGDVYKGKEHLPRLDISFTPPYAKSFIEEIETEGNNILFNWKNTQNENSSFNLQIYYDTTKRKELALDETRNTFDLDFTHNINLSDNHEIVWGIGYRSSKDKTNDTFILKLTPNDFNLEIYNFFIQDQINIFSDKLYFTPGVKIEDNPITDTEYQPSLKFLYLINTQNTLWSSISKANRIPDRYHSHGTLSYVIIPSQPPILLQNDNTISEYKVEELIAYELGYRYKINNFSLDLSLFYNEYENLKTDEPLPPSFKAFPTPHLIISKTTRNNLYGNTYGLELSSHIKIKDNWKIIFNYSMLKMNLKITADSTDFSEPEEEEGETPTNQLSIHSLYNFNEKLDLDFYLYYVDKLKSQDIEDYTRFDIRIGWNVNENLTISLVGQNLLDKMHNEFSGTAAGLPSASIERSAYLLISKKY